MSTRAATMAAIIDTLDASASLVHWTGPPVLDAFPSHLYGRGFYVVPAGEDVGARMPGVGRFGTVLFDVVIPYRTTLRAEAGTEAAMALATTAVAALDAAEPLDGARIDVVETETETADDGQIVVATLRVEARGIFTA